MGPTILVLVALLFIQVSCEPKNSLTVVIDDTGSMQDELSQVKFAAKSIVDIVLNETASQIEDIVLVTFNDPSVAFRKRTRDADELKRSLDKIYPDGGGYCPEKALTGIKLALEESQPGSYLFVFTDAGANDQDKLKEVMLLCQEKQSQIVIVLTGDCGDIDIYYKIAAASNGQVFMISKDEVGQVLEYVKETIKGDRSVITNQVVPPLKWYNVPFTIDDKTEYAIVSASGKHVYLKVKDSYNSEITKYTWITRTEHVKVLKLSNLRPGSYVAQVFGSTNVNVMVFARTDFTFQYGFSSKQENSLKLTETQPTIGTPTHLMLSVKDEEHSVTIETVQILNMDEKVLSTLPLTKMGENLYATQLFVPPEHTFKVAVTATSRSTGRPLRRIAKTPVKPIRPVTVAPEIIDSEKYLKKREGTTVEIHCRIRRGKPKPHVTWYFKQRSATTFKLIPDKMDEDLRLTNVLLGDAGHYKCVAKNTVGSAEHIVQLEVEAPPRIVFIPPNSPNYIGVEGDLVMKLQCTAEGHPTPRISWIVDKTKIGTDKSKQSYVAAGALFVKKPTSAHSTSPSHSYMCSATNTLGEAHEYYQVNVSQFEDYQNPEEKYGEIGKPYVLHCPLPFSDPNSVRWFYNSVYMNKTGPSLQWYNGSQADSGNYTCRVTDTSGAATHTVELFFGDPPSTSVTQYEEEWNGELLQITCTTNHNPSGKYEWFYKGKKVKETSNAFELSLDVTGWGQYICRVSNVLGSLNITYNFFTHDCVIDTNISKTKNMPIVLDKTSAWPAFTKNQQYLVVPHSEKLKMICQDEPPRSKSVQRQALNNRFTKYPSARSIEVTCDHEDLVVIDGVTHKISKLDCIQPVTPSIVPTGKQCLGENTGMTNIGFYVNDFIKVYSSCLDTNRNLPLYTTVNMRGSQNPMELKKHISKCRNVGGCCYETVQLVNAEDVSFGAAEKTTLREPLNSVTYCKPNDNTTSWHDIERQVRKGPRMTVWSGVSNYTKVDNMEVPQYLWKVVKDLDSAETVAIVHSNAHSPVAKLCADDCHSFSVLSLFEPQGARTYCCSLNEFKKAFKLSVPF